MIPIVFEHDYTKPIGYIELKEGKLKVKFNEPITKKDFFKIFPNVGFRYTVKDKELNDDETWITDIEIIEFSLMP